jgi:hypothetical protein
MIPDNHNVGARREIGALGDGGIEIVLVSANDAKTIASASRTIL